MNATLIQYNSYFNNTVIKAGDLLSNYTSNRTYVTINDVKGFNKADGVNTQYIFNYPQSSGNIVDDSVEYDYFILAEDNGTIISRWFVIESQWQRKGQRRLTLRRDLRVDFYSVYNAAPLYIERGICGSSDSAIYNSEGFQFNQVLESTTLLQDGYSTNGWIVGFVANNSPELKIPDNPNVLEIDSLEELPIYEQYKASQRGKLITIPSSYEIQYNTAKTNETSTTSAFRLTCDNTRSYCKNETISSTYLVDYIDNGSASAVQTAIQNYTVPMAYFKDFLDDYTTMGDTTAWDGRYVLVKNTGMRYQIRIVAGTVSSHTLETSSSANDWISNMMDDIESYLDAAGISSGTVTSATPSKRYKYATRKMTYGSLTIALTVVGDSAFKVYTYPAQTMSLSTINPYNMFYCEYTNENAKNMAFMLSYLKSAGYLYDAQLVPFKPVTNTSDHLATCTFGTTTYYFIEQYYRSYAAAINNPYARSARDTKTDAMTCMMRICASDHSATFEFSPAKAGFTANQISIMCYQTLLPHNSQIYVTPFYTDGITHGLYGKTNINNNTGLIYTLKNTLPLSTNEWISYQAQNSAYSDAYQREVEHTETINDYQMWSDVGSAFTGALSAGVQGYGISRMGALNPFGMTAGAGLISAGAGIADVSLNIAQRDENLKYMQDQHNYSLRNIQGRANSLVATGINTKTNHLFPMIEVYKPTTSELEEWTSYEQYYAWNIGKIGTFSNYYTSTTKARSRYIKCHMLATKTPAATGMNTSEDCHLYEALDQELSKGGYYYI